MQIPEELKEFVTCDADVLGAMACFAGTRVPLATFLDCLQSGYSLDRFLQGYPSVERDKAIAVLTWISKQSRLSLGIDLAS